MKTVVEASKSWRTTAAAIAAVAFLVSKWPHVDQDDFEKAVLAIGLFFAADASAARSKTP